MFLQGLINLAQPSPRGFYHGDMLYHNWLPQRYQKDSSWGWKGEMELVMCIFSPYSEVSMYNNTSIVSMHNKPKEIRLFITENPSHFSLLSLPNLVNHSLNSALNLDYVLNAGSNLWVTFLCSLTKIWTSAKYTKECFLHYKSQL